MTDIAQILLQNGLIGAILLFVAVWITVRAFRASWSGVVFVIRKIVPPFRWRSAWILSLGGCLLWSFNAPLSNLLQDIEQRYINPVYVSGYQPDSTGLIEIYEKRIADNCTGNQFQIVRDSTRAIAARIGSTPRAIYETALLECGLKWWDENPDGPAYGYIQFTNLGIKKMENQDGSKVELNDIKNACRSRSDAGCAYVMYLTGQYLERKAKRIPEGATLANTIDLYLAVFAPAHIGKAENQVVYSGLDNPAYYKNAGLDGWWIENGKILSSKSARDSKITVLEIWCALESKRAKLIKN